MKLLFDQGTPAPLGNCLPEHSVERRRALVDDWADYIAASAE